MSSVTAFIAAETAKLVRLVPTPTGALGYGTDLSCTSDLTETMDEVDPLSPVAIQQSLIRRLTTRRGRLPDDPSYGLDIRGFLNHGTPASEFIAIEGQIRQEVLKDDRVSSAVVAAAYAAQTKTLTIKLSFVPVDSRATFFTLTFAITTLSVVVEELGLVISEAA